MPKRSRRLDEEKAYLVCYFVSGQLPESPQATLFLESGERMGGNTLRASILRFYTPEIMLDLGPASQTRYGQFESALAKAVKELQYADPSRCWTPAHETVLFYIAKHSELDGMCSDRIFGSEHCYAPENFERDYFLSKAKQSIAATVAALQGAERVTIPKNSQRIKRKIIRGIRRKLPSKEEWDSQYNQRVCQTAIALGVELHNRTQVQAGGRNTISSLSEMQYFAPAVLLEFLNRIAPEKDKRSPRLKELTPGLCKIPNPEIDPTLWVTRKALIDEQGTDKRKKFKALLEKAASRDRKWECSLGGWDYFLDGHSRFCCRKGKTGPVHYLTPTLQDGWEDSDKITQLLTAVVDT